MNVLPRHILEKLEGKYAESSLKTMSGQIQRLLKSLGAPYSRETLLDIDVVEGELLKFDKASVRKNILQTLITVLKADGVSEDDLSRHTELLENLRKDHSEKYLMSSDKSLIKMDEVVQLREKYRERLPSGDRTTHLRFVVLSLYTYLPPLRGQDYCNTEFVYSGSKSGDDLEKFYEETPHNLYDVDKGMFVIKEHKTAKTHGERRIQTGPSLMQIMKEWSEKNETPYLVPTITGTKMSQNGFTDLLWRIFREITTEKISVDTLRHSFITEMSNDPRFDSEKAKEIAKIMGHTVTTQQMIYKKWA
jgi:Phage integrase family